MSETPITPQAPETSADSTLKDFMQQERAFRKQYLRKHADLSEEGREKIQVAAQEMFNLYLTLTPETQKDYFKEITESENFFNYEAEIHYYFILIMKHMLETDIEFLQTYLARLQWIFNFNGEFSQNVAELAIDLLKLQMKHEYKFILEQVVREEKDDKYYCTILKRQEYKKLKATFNYLSSRFCKSLKPKKTIVRKTTKH